MNRRRLQAVQRVREIQQRNARGELARQSQRHQHAQALERHTWERLDDSTTESGRIGAMHAVREAGARAAATQHTVTETAHQRVLVARDEWTEAARRVEALDRLGERLRESEAVEAERVSNNEIDDLVLARRNVQLASARGAR